ncbi:MAG: PDZ domain-containing protein [Planctomycetes bacterium]|nr:PDZ domain-containing protein [Planctomycetota bacterium]
MNGKIITVLMAVLLVTLRGDAAEENKGAFAERAVLGVRIDPSELGDLLRKHLRLKESEGLLVRNIQIDSPAAKAGLVRDDIIVGLNGKGVSDYEEFVLAIRSAGVGAQVELEVIHLGERQKVSVTLAKYESSGKWQYPIESEDQNWRRQIPYEEWAPRLKNNFKEYFYRQKHIQTTPDGKRVEISIEGDPADGDATIIVREEGEAFTTTVDRIDSLPKRYRQMVREVVEKARKNRSPFYDRFVIPRSNQPRGKRLEIPEFPWGDRDFFREDLLRDPLGHLEERIRNLEKQLEAFRDRLDGKKQSDKSEGKEGKEIY